MEEESKMPECHHSSAAAFVEGGIQDACDDSCSICLESFSETDPSTVTGCKHEFHLQCILEWCQRSSQCPMCWQPISLKDPTSHELLEAVERERNIRTNQTRTTAIFHHPALGEFELQHLPIGANDADLEEQILQHLAAAAAIGRTHHLARREGRGRSGGNNRPQFLVFSRHPSAPSAGSVSTSSAPVEVENEPTSSAISPRTSRNAEPVNEDSVPQIIQSQVEGVANFHSGPAAAATAAVSRSPSDTRSYLGQNSPVSQDRAGHSDFQSFSESLKSRINAVSMRYKESFTKSTRGWKERLFSRSSSVADIGSEVRREVNAGIATVSRMIERLETRESRIESTSSTTHSSEGASAGAQPNGEAAENYTENLQTGNNVSASHATTSAST